jgi:hypothetical protein
MPSTDSAADANKELGRSLGEVNGSKYKLQDKKRERMDEGKKAN